MSRRNPRRRSHKLRNTAVGGFGALIAAILLLLRFGGGGLLGDGIGSLAPASGENAVDAAPKAALGGDGGASATRCALRIDHSGLSLAGKAIAVDKAVATCRKSGSADLVVTGDANYGLFQRVRAALEAAKVKVYVR